MMRITDFVLMFFTVNYWYKWSEVTAFVVVVVVVVVVAVDTICF